MNSMIFNPSEEFESKYRELHFSNTNKFFENLVQQSGIDIEKNRETLRLHQELKENRSKLNTKLFWWRVLRVVMCITLILIPLVILKITPIIRALREEIADADKRAEELMEEAWNQMAPLNTLFTDRDSLGIIESTLPLVGFKDNLSVEQEADMRTNYDYFDYNTEEHSTLEVLAGYYNENPFFFENRMIHTMGTETYHGSLTITWTETYYDSDGNRHTRTRSETLHASVVKPKPYYNTQVILNYCAQGGPELSFTREPGHLERKSQKEIDKLVKKGEKTLNKMTNKAIKENSEFMAMSNTEFEILFNALDRDNEVQFRTLFTPLAQTNMAALIRSQSGCGDDFHFFKHNRTNRIVTEHSQGRVINLTVGDYVSYSYDIIKDNFINKNVAFFRAVYFDFAPLFAIPIYQERPVHSLKPIPDYSQKYTLKECESLANLLDYSYVVHPQTKTQAILKSSFVGNNNDSDVTRITAYSYDIEPRIDYVPVYGGDGRYHDVPVPWDEYLPLVAENDFFVSKEDASADKNVIARHNGLCIFNS